MLQVVEINAIEDLEAMRLRWTSLFYQTRGGSIFQTLDWLKVYWSHFHDSQRLRVLLVYRSGTVIGILPLVDREDATAAGPVDALTYPTISPSHFYGPIGPNPTATLMVSLRHLASQSRDLDLLSLAAIGEHDRGRTANAMQLAGFATCEEAHASVSKVYFDASRMAQRFELETELNDLDRESKRAGNIRFERIRPLGSLYGDDQPLQGIVEECIELAGHSSSGRPFPETTTAFLHDVVATASRLGMLDLNLLRLDGRLIAISLNVHFNGAIQQLYVGRDADSFAFDAASLLTLRMLQDSFARKDHGIYFAESNDGVTHRWATQHVPVVRYQHRAALPLHARWTRFGQWLAMR